MTPEDERGAPSEAPKSSGPQRIGRYELIERIGKGGMGVVYRARDTVLGRPVAVKMLVTDLEVSDETRERFFREARSAGQLTHRNIITIYDFGEENGRAYIVMELLQGESLTGLMAREPSLPLEQRVDIMMRVCEGLGFAHTRSIVHRDVKPGNLFITTDGQLKILDFGVARIASSNLTRSGLIVGTPDYMSPEQVQGKIVDQRSDIFSAGAVFYQVLTGRKPFAAKGLPMVLQKVVSEEPPPLRDVESPPELAAIVSRALEKDPSRRYQQMQDMVADLARFLQAYDQQTRERCLRSAEVFQKVEDLIAERRALAATLQVDLPHEEVSVLPMLRELPLFGERGADVFRVVPFRRAAVTDILERLEQQSSDLSTQTAGWRVASDMLLGGERALAGGDCDGALSAFGAALRLVPTSAKLETLVDQAQAELAARRVKEQRARALLTQARDALAGSLWDMAADRLSDAEAAAPWLDGIDSLRREVLAAREAEAARRRDEVAKLIVRGDRALKGGDLREADELLRDAATLEDASPDVAAFRERVARAKAEAADRDERARRAHAAIDVARTVFERGQRDAALALLRDAIAADSRLPGLSEELERLTLEDKRLTDLARRHADAVEKAQNAERELEGGRLREAQRLAAASLALEPSNALAIRIRAEAETRIAAAEAAERLAAELARLLADGRTALKAGDLKRAMRRAREALDKDVHSADAHALQAEVERTQRARDEQIERERVRRAQERAVRPALKIARAALGRGDYARAMWAAENALAIQPGSPDAQEILERAKALGDRSAHDDDDTLSLDAAAVAERDNTVAMQESGFAAWSASLVAWAGGVYRRIAAFRMRVL
jgi:serine/threonine-protein kinase